MQTMGLLFVVSWKPRSSDINAVQAVCRYPSVQMHLRRVGEVITASSSFSLPRIPSVLAQSFSLVRPFKVLSENNIQLGMKCEENLASASK